MPTMPSPPSSLRDSLPSLHCNTSSSNSAANFVSNSVIATDLSTSALKWTEYFHQTSSRETFDDSTSGQRTAESEKSSAVGAIVNVGLAVAEGVENGTSEGDAEGAGLFVGLLVGESEGFADGDSDGPTVGFPVGDKGSMV
mmetsp:Transcript_12244/g.29172  ORF Transcript_12244/g.29172 Transcript_12244/m.29172 type:complete len:141 (+) Transcript_12244:1041-1463(+)